MYFYSSLALHSDKLFSFLIGSFRVLYIYSTFTQGTKLCTIIKQYQAIVQRLLNPLL